ncbi:MAG TPA: D-Ala-D-Ala carboxypeptidase family metallohydrolase [Nostocaceae cyanobacterium]|nr:D-Ala-D-Ala carboxypeptidase family metallohydrolase [Nostocaceae cyanobacterium]
MADINVEALKNFANSKAEKKLVAVDKDVAQAIQNLLKISKYYTGEVDGIVANRTLDAFAKFKKEHWLEYPDTLGPTTALSLLEILEEHQGSTDQPQPSSGSQSSKTGPSMKLPSGKTVYSDERIIDTIPLTWGEVTAKCTRVPEDKIVVENIEKIARVYAEVRDKYGSPLDVMSGYRSPEINLTIGGSKNSQHILGLALDIYPLDKNLRRLYDVCKAIPSVVGLGSGMHRGFVHIDARPGGRTYWNYP